MKEEKYYILGPDNLGKKGFIREVKEFDTLAKAVFYWRENGGVIVKEINWKIIEE